MDSKRIALGDAGVLPEIHIVTEALGAGDEARPQLKTRLPKAPEQ